MGSEKKRHKQNQQKVPLLPVRDLVVFPYMILPLHVCRESSIQAVEQALSKDRLLFLSSQKNSEEESPSADGVHKVGTLAMIIRMRKLSDGHIKILIQGVDRGRISKVHHTQPYFNVDVEVMKSQHPPVSPIEKEIFFKSTRDTLGKIISLGKNISPDILLVLEDIDDLSRMADLVVSNIGLSPEKCQSVLETDDLKEKMTKVTNLLQEQLSELQEQLQSQGKVGEIYEKQKEFFLKQQMKQNNEYESKSSEIDELREKVKKAQMPLESEKEVLKQLRRLEKMHQESSESSILRNYVDWIVDLPWSVSTEDNLDLDNAKNILDQDHYSLDRVKERILEFLAVRKLKNNVKGPILCFVGPPGVGKTSLGKSVAKSMGRKYVRIALGGLKEESEIRGHRRTYVGSMPGKIIQALRQAKSKNPVILLDEIDKLGSDFRGDPSAAMLEVLDSEQNCAFKDHYINLDFDLSEVLFMATANFLENIPQALRDRMEVISLSGYTFNDKISISKTYLVPKQIENHGIKEEHVDFSNEGLSYLIKNYTREAGLRNLEREISSICRKIAKKVVLGSTDKTLIDVEQVKNFLGPEKFLTEELMTESQVGVATGMAWTQAGGEILFVEALKTEGKGELKLTGQLGDVMKESAQAAASYAKAHYKELDIPQDWFEKHSLHIHLPAGAIPKDGPSAGVTLATAMISLMTDTPVRHDLAMTGEVTLTGRVLPVGGIKEKCLAALSMGIKDIILPIGNKKDLVDIHDELRSQIQFVFVEHLDEVLAVALVHGKQKPSRRQSNSRKKTKLVANDSYSEV